MTGTDLCVNKPHKSRSYLNHLVHQQYFNQRFHNSTPGKENPTVLSTDPPLTMLEAKGGGEVSYDVTRIASFQCQCNTHAQIAETGTGGGG
jgi:hypothetical protein